jgi:hypothetical protein|tara:strand:- start:1146 stop:1868 length:723 start_codon:yes stop_codon:yes gene_type:complete
MKYKRNEFGLVEDVEYKYNEDGSINWRAMIPTEHLYPNKGWFEARNQPMPNSTEGLEDYQLLIKLSGIKELAKLRGFSNVNYDVVKCEMDHVAIKCSIDWLGNFESENQPIAFQDIANATAYNTSNFAQKFLETIATNRAFVRCVRNFLNIHIVGADEIDTSNNKSAPMQQESVAYGPLNVLMSQVKLSGSDQDFEIFKEILRGLYKNNAYKNKDVKNWKTWENIPKTEITKLIKVLKAN